MAETIPTVEPTTERAGDTWKWDKTVSDYPPSGGWALKYAFRGPASLDATATASGSTYQIRIAASATAALVAGSYRWSAWVEKGSAATYERHTVEKGVLVVEPDLATASGDQRTHVEKSLAAVEASIEKRLAADLSSYSVAERQVQKEELEKLYALRTKYRDEMRRLNGGPFLQTMKVRFGAPA